MPLCLGAFGSVRTKKKKKKKKKKKSQQHVGVVGAGRPHLPPVDHEVRRRQASARRAAARPDPEPAPGSLIPSDAVISARRIGTAHRRCCSGVPARDQRCGDDADTLRVERQVAASACKFLLMDVLLQQRGVSAAELGRECRVATSRCRTSAAASGAPSPGMWLARPRALQRLRLGRPGVRPEKRHELRTEGLDVSVEESAARRSWEEKSEGLLLSQNAKTILMMESYNL